MEINGNKCEMNYKAIESLKSMQLNENEWGTINQLKIKELIKLIKSIKSITVKFQ